MKRFLIIDAGCLECQIPTEVLGSFDTTAEALADMRTRGWKGDLVEAPLPEHFWGGRDVALILDTVDEGAIVAGARW